MVWPIACVDRETPGPLRKGKRLAAAALLGLIGVTTAALADDAVTVGAIFPSTRDSGARLAIETGVEIVNTPHPGLEKLPLGAGRGLTNVGGAKLAVSFADSLGNPSVAQAQALRLATRDKVAALIGGGAAGEMLAATALAERHGAPFLVADAMDPAITARGFRWVFRTAPLAADVTLAYARLLGALKRAGTKVDAIALVFEDSERGRHEAAALRDGLKTADFVIAAEIAYPPNATDLFPFIARLRAKNPDVAVFFSNAADAILAIKTMQNAGYKPPLLIGDGSAFSEPSFVTQVGNLAQGIITDSAWSTGKAETPAAIVNELYRRRSGRDLDDLSARVMQGFFVLADAIDRAGSAAPEAIQKALRETNLAPDQLIVGYDGVKFDEAGQNVLASTYLTQLQGKQYVPVWPAERVAGKLTLPFRGWE